MGTKTTMDTLANKHFRSSHVLRRGDQIANCGGMVFVRREVIGITNDNSCDKPEMLQLTGTLFRRTYAHPRNTTVRLAGRFVGKSVAPDTLVLYIGQTVDGFHVCIGPISLDVPPTDTLTRFSIHTDHFGSEDNTDARWVPMITPKVMHTITLPIAGLGLFRNDTWSSEIRDKNIPDTKTVCIEIDGDLVWFDKTVLAFDSNTNVFALTAPTPRFSELPKGHKRKSHPIATDTNSVPCKKSTSPSIFHNLLGYKALAPEFITRFHLQ